ncbi:MAG: 3-dehydroquinate dehydratase [Rikenellaceae bacterium]|nr:3-dehydroquinate dehydratase [Rikenellaceae bacterium]
MKFLIINGPNLNLLGKREPTVYGSRNFEAYLRELREFFSGDTVDYFQSNVEGELIDALHEADDKGYDAVLLNAGGYTHTSVALADAVGAISTPVVEVHISCILAREEFRHVSLIAPRCAGSIMGFGLDSYRLGILSAKKREV